MSKYIDAEKLIAEIERRLVKYDSDYTSAGSELKELLSFIASLQQEQPEVDMDNAAQDYVRDYFCPGADFTPEYIKHLMEDAFVGGATWKAESLPKQEQPEVDLEAEIYKLYDGEYHDTEDVARHFYELGCNARKED